MHDLTQVLDMRLRDIDLPQKFMIFTNSQTSAEMTCNRLHSDLPGHLQGRIVWFHSGMMMMFHIDAISKLQEGELWGIYCTNVAGMVSDNYI
jgi:Lhr-like helicase